MIPMLKYLESNQHKKTEYTKTEKARHIGELSELLEKRKKQSEADGDHKDLIGRTLRNSFMKKILVGHEQLVCSDWEKEIEKSSRYKKPFLMNKSEVGLDPENTFVLPLFLKPGKNNFFIFTENGE